MDDPSSADDYEVQCSAMKIHTAYHPQVEIRVRRPNEPEHAVTFVYYDGFPTEGQALADAHRQAEVIKAHPADHLE